MEAAQLTLGSRFGAYEIVRAVGSGAFGTVYEALKMPLRKRVALKVLSADMTRHREAAARFLREAEATAQVAHPHIVDVQDFGEVEGVPYLSMEFLEGETLAARINQRAPLSVTEAANLLLPILSAMTAVHGRHIVHRDLKPENIFLARGIGGDHPKLLDFGIAKVQQIGASLTRTSALLGTPCYMSPEQVRDAKHIDGRSDLWSIGVILYECITRRRPFEGESSYDVMEQIVRASIIPPRAIVPSIPDSFESVLAKALQRDPALRFSSARDFGTSLMPFANPLIQATFGSQFGSYFDGRLQPEPSLPPRSDSQPVPTLISIQPTLSAHEISVAPLILERRAPPRRVVAAMAMLTAILLLGALLLSLPREPPGPVIVAPRPGPSQAQGARPATSTPHAPVTASSPQVAEAPPVARVRPTTVAPGVRTVGATIPARAPSTSPPSTPLGATRTTRSGPAQNTTRTRTQHVPTAPLEAPTPTVISRPSSTSPQDRPAQQPVGSSIDNL